uniref:Leucine-rich repeat-containing N-terminal plant-type domain-containing protein n=1 Tax=Manihot esculenta TaxID=3983 RepID=A0A2C9VWQ0_MANES
MGFSVVSQNKNIFVILLFLSFFLAAETRPLRDQQWLKMNEGLLFESLQKTSGPNPCSNVPGQGSGICTRKIAGRAPSAFPDLIIDVAVAASVANNDTNQDSIF